MKRSLCNVLAGCVLAVILAVPNAQADSGRMTFSGAIVESTCSTNDADITTTQHAGYAPDAQRHACGGANSVADAGRSYAVAVISLDPATTGRDPLLHYFAGYLGSVGVQVTAAKLVVRTYE